MATVPKFHDVHDIPLITDADVLDRVAALIQHAIRRQVWLMFLDEDSRQLPVLMPSYVPRTPRPGDGARLGEFFRLMAGDCDASTVVLTLERRGRADLSEADRKWLRMLREACLLAEIQFRGPLLCHNDGVRWVPLDEYLDAGAAGA